MRGIGLAAGVIGVVSIITAVVLLILVECDVIKKQIPSWVYSVILSAALVPLLYMVYDSLVSGDKRPPIVPIEESPLPNPKVTSPVVMRPTSEQVFVDIPIRANLFVNTGLRTVNADGTYENSFLSADPNNKYGAITLHYDRHGNMVRAGTVPE